jgi:hypothetical protein
LAVNEQRLRRLEAAKTVEQLDGPTPPHAEQFLDYRTIHDWGLQQP